MKYILNNLLQKKVELALASTQQTFWESGQKAGRLLSNRIKQLKENRMVPLIRDKLDQSHRFTSGIVRQFTNFYQELYTQPDEENVQDIDGFLHVLEIPTCQSLLQLKRWWVRLRL